MQSTNLTNLDRRRIQRKLSEQGQNWHELEEIYQSMGESIVEVGTTVNEAIRLINQIQRADKQELVIITQGIVRDIEAFTQDLIKIHQRHMGYQGLIKNEDELALCLSIFGDYTILSDRFKAIIFIPMLTVSEFLADAAQHIAKPQ